MNIVTVVGFVAAFLTTVSFLPQALKTIRTKNTAGISIFMYSLFALGTFCWLVFGLLSNNMPVVVANAVTMVFAVIIPGYKIKYR